MMRGKIMSKVEQLVNIKPPVGAEQILECIDGWSFGEIMQFHKELVELSKSRKAIKKEVLLAFLKDWYKDDKIIDEIRQEIMAEVFLVKDK